MAEFKELHCDLCGIRGEQLKTLKAKQATACIHIEGLDKRFDRVIGVTMFKWIVGGLCTAFVLFATAIFGSMLSINENISGVKTSVAVVEVEIRDVKELINHNHPAWLNPEPSYKQREER